MASQRFSAVDACSPSKPRGLRSVANVLSLYSTFVFIYMFICSSSSSSSSSIDKYKSCN